MSLSKMVIRMEQDKISPRANGGNNNKGASVVCMAPRALVNSHRRRRHSSSMTSLRRTHKSLSLASQNTRAEFKRLKTILPSIKCKDNVSRLDIILEAIKYIDDLQDQLIDRLSGPKDEREAVLLALTERDMERNRVQQRLRKGSDDSDNLDDLDDLDSLDSESEDMTEAEVTSTTTNPQLSPHSTMF